MGKKTVLITGGSRGIGEATAKCFYKNGYEIVMPTRNELDLSNKDDVQRFLNSYRDFSFDCLVNCAGINIIAEIDDLREENIESMVSVNLLSPIQLIKGIVANMKKRKYGRIVNIGSIWGIVGKPGRVAYAATKHGIHGVTQTLAVELAPYNILVNTVCPGFTMTDLTYQNNSKEQLDEIANQIPLGRLAEPEEQAEIIYYFGSENNTYVTGQQIIVDGGYTIQ